METPKFLQFPAKDEALPPRPGERYAFGPFEVDVDRHLLTRSGSALAVPPKCFDLLCLLVTSNGGVLGKEQLMQELWPNTFVEEANLSNLIAVLRKLLGDTPSQSQYIQTVPRLGYRFAAAVSTASTQPVRPHLVPAPMTIHTAADASRAEDGFWVAVLPFRHAGADAADLAPIADELSLEIATGLSRFSYLRVIAPAFSMHSSQRRTNVRIVGQELGARYIVDGSVRRRNESLLVAVQLVDAGSGVHLWAEIYERAFVAERVSGLKDDVAPRVVSTIADTYGVLTHTMSEALRAKNPGALNPYEAVLRCFGYYARMTPDEHAEVRASLESALAEAPNNADVAAMLAIIYLDEYSVGFNLRPDPLQRSLECAMRATVAAPSNSLSHYALACARFFRKEFAGFRTAVERCIALNPMNGSSLAGLGLMMSAGVGEWARGVCMAQRAIDLNPNHPGWYWFAVAYDAYHHQDYREALSLAFRINMPGFYNTHALLAASYAQLGELDAASQSMQKVLELRPDYSLIARQECEKWFCPEFVEHFLQGFHKAGMTIPDREGNHANGTSRAQTKTRPGTVISNIENDKSAGDQEIHMAE